MVYYWVSILVGSIQHSSRWMLVNRVYKITNQACVWHKGPANTSAFSFETAYISMRLGLLSTLKTLLHCAMVLSIAAIRCEKYS